MSVEVFWDNDEQTVLHYRFAGEWTEGEYFTALPRGRAMMAAVNHRVAIINDMLETQHVPSSFLSKARSVIDSRPANAGLSVFVSTSVFFRATHEVFCTLYPDWAPNFPLVPTLDEARQKIDDWMAGHESLH